MLIENIAVTVNRKNIKNMYIRIQPPDGNVKVSAPLFVSDEEIIAFVKSKREWILKKQKYILENDIKAPLKYVNGEKHYLWGKEHTLQLISNHNVKHVLVNENIIYLPIPKRSTIEKRKNILDEFYRQELKRAIPEALDKCSKIVGRTPKSITVRKMKNWGNCKQDGRITLNLNLAKKDKECLEYVMIHELCHLIEFNHGKNFKKLMDKFCPDWKIIKKRLNE
ncbi:MAG: M48 family metallopeptidase [Methanobrevibacter thaueri]|uniref:M48 family metallopeptidase n=1 Tax=Methanobrevibacter thaueri TaxID=190975 RepID=A0A8T3VDF2_9EURY|nr:SprT family zinc-dependent metalloprotease [Methanobrevibacter thaueri]MBE6501365.1 M48 family metallopeptidase [Methanobrevibacter thaueri]